MARKFGLIGYPLTHTFSPKYFAKKFSREHIDAEYKAYEIDNVSKVLSLFEDGLEGLNVTIPYKEQVIPYLDSLSPEAEAVGAVNTIKKVEGTLVGFNTDIYGFKESITRMALPFEISGKKALIMGSGGASKAILHVLESMGCICHIVSRKSGGTAHLTYKDLSPSMLESYACLVNTTPLGMYPKDQEMPDIPHNSMHSKQLAYDLIYNPEITLFLNRARNQGATIKNGAEMLILQAEKSWEIWNA